jgi:hypothetical protein
LSGERPPVRIRSSPLHGGRGVEAAPGVVNPAGAGSSPAGHPRSLADAEQMESSAGCNPVASCCGGSTPPVRTAFQETRGCSSTWSSASLATRKMSVRLRPSPLCLRSVNGKHAPFVRPRCGFNSCRRLLQTPVAQRSRALSCDGRGRWFESSRAYHLADVAQKEEHRSATPGRPVRPGSSALTGPWCNGSTTSSNLVGPGSRPGGPAARPRSSRAGAARLSHGKERPCSSVSNGRCGSTPPTTAHHDRDVRPAPGRNGSGYRLIHRQVAGSNPARSAGCSGSSVVEQFRAVQPRPQQ